jgi:hypothetical protein
VWAALVTAPTWSVVTTEHPDPNWREPEEVWTVTPQVVKR